jgi:two-component system nitrate/nitrite response regulator NarL
MQHESVADSNPIRIVIAAAQSPFRKILRMQLEREPLVQVVGETPDSLGARALTRRLKPDILLIEAALNREFAAQSLLARSPSSPRTGIVVLVAAAEIRNIVEAFELGARGIVLSASLPNAWQAGMQSVLAGQFWVGDESVAILIETARKVLMGAEPRTVPKFGLTPREVEIAAKIATGLSNREIGQTFSICERTVKHHLTNIFKKAGVSTRLELALLMRDKGAARPIAVAAQRARPAIDQRNHNLTVASSENSA